MKNKLLNTLLILLALLITYIAIATGSYFREGLTVEEGQISQQKVKATRLVENRVATERNRLEAEARAADRKPIVTLDAAVSGRVHDNLEALFDKLSHIRQSYQIEIEERQLAEEEAERLAEEQRTQNQLERERLERERLERERLEQEALMAAGDNPDTVGSGEASGGITVNPVQVNPEEDVPTQTPDDSNENGETTGSQPIEAYGLFTALPVIFTELQQQYLVLMTEDEYDILTQTVYDVTSTLMEQGVEELDNKTMFAVREEFNKSPLTDDISNIGYKIVSSYLIVNMFVNEEATRQDREQIAANYETVYLLKNQTIVDEGEKITQEAYAIMESLGMLNTGIENKIIPLIGVCILIAILYAACIMYFYFQRKKLLIYTKERFLLLTLYLITLIMIWTITKVSSTGDVAYAFLPLLIFPMLVSILIDLRTSIILSLCMTMVCYFIVSGTIEFLLFYLISGTMICLLAKYTTDRNKVFMVCMMAAIVNFTVSCAIALIIDQNNAINLWQQVLTMAGIAALNGMLVVIICIGSLPFWEAFFGVATPVKLLDLTNPTNLLLRRLTIEAPGTYHHSLIVANLAETAAYDIGANPNTARVGGYYHDIGKLKYPQYFVENLAGENPHDSMDPFNSAQLIISHVTYGLTLATEYRLPQFIRDIIREHHGTSLIRYFYVKAKTEITDRPVEEKDFRYPYAVPQTRESACVMLADTVEAAIRSMITRVKSVDEVESQIGKLIQDKLHDGQLADSGLTIKDVTTITQSFFRVLKGMYHERIPYPKLAPEKTADAEAD